MNPLNMIKGMMGISNPKDIVMKLLSQNNNPIFNNLIEMANKNDVKGLENFTRNICKEKNIDFDKEFSNFKDMFK